MHAFIVGKYNCWKSTNGLILGEDWECGGGQEKIKVGKELALPEKPSSREEEDRVGNLGTCYNV